MESCKTSVGLDKGFLRQVVGQRVSAAGESSQEAAHRRLVLAHELAEGVPVVTGQHAGNELRVAIVCAWMIRLGHGFVTAWRSRLEPSHDPARSKRVQTLS
jgi:hypothetical protein